MASSTVTVESETLEAFLPDLMTAICDDVQRITDQCLANGIISDSRRRRILEAKGTEDQTRALIQCVQNGTKTDSRCFEIFLDCLDKELPRLVKGKLLPDMRRDLAERASIRKAVVPSAGFPKHQEDDRILCLQQQSSLFGRYENSMKKYAHASAEKGLCEQSLQSKTEESGQLRSTLEILRNHSAANSQVIDNTVERLSACEMEMTVLKERIEKLEGVVQEEDMQARRGKSIIMVGTKAFARMTEEQFAATLMEKDEECKRLLKEREDELRRRMEEEMDIRVKDLKHRVEIQQTQLQVKELELRNARLRQETSSNLNPNPSPPINTRTNRVSHSLGHYFHPSLTSRPQFTVLLKELHQVRDDWENIGIQLNIEDWELMAIRRNNCDSKACLREMLRMWLRRVAPRPRPSWQAVIDALHTLGHERIANRLDILYVNHCHNN